MAELVDGPAWADELSSTRHAHEDTVRVTIPLGAHVTVGVYNTDVLAPRPPDGIEAVVRVIWSEHRTVFAGLDEEREAAIPFYLPKPDPEAQNCEPTGAWAVELEPAQLGVFTVPIQCDSNTVTVEVNCIELPASDIGYGLFTDMYKYPDRTKEREYNRDMVRHGMNTFVARCGPLPPALGAEINGWENGDRVAVWPSKMSEWRWHIDAAIECGLVDVRFPVIALLGPDDRVLREVRKHEDWPELIGYSIDEPAIEDEGRVKEKADAWRSLGFRAGTAISGPPVKALGHLLDVWILNAPDTSAEIIELAQQMGKERWSYMSSLRGTNAPLLRYWAGLYTYAVNPVVCLAYIYMPGQRSRIMPDGVWNMERTYGLSAADAEGYPVPTVGLKGMADGIVDSRLLQELGRRDTCEGNAYLAALRKQVDLGFWPEGKSRKYGKDEQGDKHCVWDVPDTAVPPIDLVAMRREVCGLLGLD